MAHSTKRQPANEPAPQDWEAADRLHSAAIHLLRRLRVEDAAAGLTAPRLSALSVIVFGGPIALTALAMAEQVQPPTITRLVRDLERDGLVERVPDVSDRRIQRVHATARGRQLLQEGRMRRVAKLAAELSALEEEERRLLIIAAHLLERISRPEHARTSGSGLNPAAQPTETPDL